MRQRGHRLSQIHLHLVLLNSPVVPGPTFSVSSLTVFDVATAYLGFCCTGFPFSTEFSQRSLLCLKDVVLEDKVYPGTLWKWFICSLTVLTRVWVKTPTMMFFIFIQCLQTWIYLMTDASDWWHQAMTHRQQIAIPVILSGLSVTHLPLLPALNTTSSAALILGTNFCFSWPKEIPNSLRDYAHRCCPVSMNCSISSLGEQDRYLRTGGSQCHSSFRELKDFLSFSTLSNSVIGQLLNCVYFIISFLSKTLFAWLCLVEGEPHWW